MQKKSKCTKKSQERNNQLKTDIRQKRKVECRSNSYRDTQIQTTGRLKGKAEGHKVSTKAIASRTA